MKLARGVGIQGKRGTLGRMPRLERKIIHGKGGGGQREGVTSRRTLKPIPEERGIVG